MPSLSFDPFADPGALDVMTAANVQSPGLFVLQPGSGREYNWQIQKAPGVQGVTMTYRGWLPTENIQGEFVFWQQGQVEEFFSTFLPLFVIDAMKFNPRPVQVYHPILMANDITALVTKKIGNLEGDSGRGWKLKMTWNEFRVARIIREATPTGATTRIGQPTPQSKIDEQILAELARAQQPL